MKQSGASTRLSGAVQDLASEVVLALKGEGRPSVVCGTAGIGGDEIGVAAVRVLGADVLLPSTMFRLIPQPTDLAVFRKAVDAFPPRSGASSTTEWSHWAMTRALRAATAGAPVPAGHTPGPGADEPDASWLDAAPWQQLGHQLSMLGALAVPGSDCGVARAAARRPIDVARGFVRAVRRRDWLQAAGTGRWLTVIKGVPPTVGLDAGLEFVAHMGGADPRVSLHVRAAQLIRSGAGA